MGRHAFVMMAEGRLSNAPKTNPVTQLGHGSVTTPMTKPIAKRSTNAEEIAARLSGNDMGIMERAANVPKVSPATTP